MIQLRNIRKRVRISRMEDTTKKILGGNNRGFFISGIGISLIVNGIHFRSNSFYFVIGVHIVIILHFELLLSMHVAGSKCYVHFVLLRN